MFAQVTVYVTYAHPPKEGEGPRAPTNHIEKFAVLSGFLVRTGCSYGFEYLHTFFSLASLSLLSSLFCTRPCRGPLRVVCG